MKKILNLAIRLTVVFQSIYYIFFYLNYLRGFYDSATANLTRYLLNYVVPFFIFIILLCIFWIYSNKISEKIIGNNDEYLININYKEILSIVIIVLGISFLIDNMGSLMYNICYILSEKINYKLNIDYFLFMEENENYNYKSYVNYSYIISDIFSSFINCIISLCLLIFRRKIIKHFEKI
jgi:hypothetical protein